MDDLFDNAAGRSTESADRTYTAKDIEVLEGLEPVRRRPAMYIGGTDERALHHLVAELLDNAMDEAVAGQATRIELELAADDTVTVRDNGRGIPVDPHPRFPDRSALEVILCTLHAGGKFSGKAYQTSGGLHGVGVSVVNALSDWLELRIWRDGKEHHARFERGETVEHLRVVGEAGGERGTEVRFLASLTTFSNLDYSFKTLEARLRELAFLNSGVCIELVDERHGERREVAMHYEGGVREFVRWIDRSKQPLIPEPIFIEGERDGITVEVAMWWNDGFNEMVLPFTNNIPQRDGGTHLAGFRGALTRTINLYAGSSGLARRDGPQGAHPAARPLADRSGDRRAHGGADRDRPGAPACGRIRALPGRAHRPGRQGQRLVRRAVRRGGERRHRGERRVAGPPGVPRSHVREVPDGAGAEDPLPLLRPGRW